MRFRSFWVGLLASAAMVAPGAAQVQYFGKNKVQYRDEEWRVLETRHFEVHFYASEAAMVQDAARLAERSYSRISRTLGHQLSRRVPLVLYASHSDFQQTHITPGLIDVGTGGITDLARRRVFLPFNGSWGDFQHVLTHELVHAFEIDILFDGSRSDPLNPFASAPPLWVMEGLAEYLSRPHEDSYTAMWLRDAALGGTLLTLPQLERVGDIRVYRFGQSAFEYFAATHGTEKIGDLLRAIAETRSLDRAFDTVTGQSLEQFSEAWTLAIRRRHLPALESRQLAREFATPIVTRKSEDASMLLVPSISPNGRYMAYVSDAGLTRDLYVRDLEHGHSRRLVRGERSGDFESLRFFTASTAWAPDGRTLAFVSQARGQDALNLLNVETGRVVAKHRFGLDEMQTPTFSPDGSELIFVGLSGGQSDLYRVRADGSDLRRLTTDRAAERDPQWAPDGHRLLFVTDAGPDTDFEALRFGAWKLVCLDLDTEERRTLQPFTTGNVWSPVWSGTGDAIACIADPDGVPNLYLVYPETGNVFRLCDTMGGVGGVLPTSPALSWARDTDRLVFSVFNQSGWDIYRIDRPASHMRPLEEGPVPAVVAATNGGLQLRVAAADSHATATPDTLAARRRPAADSAANAMLLKPVPAETEAFTERRYRARLAPDVSSVGGVVGTQGGIGGASLLHFSDLLGNHTLSVGFGIYGSLKDSDLSVEYSNRKHRTNTQFGAFQYQRRYGFLGSPAAAAERQTYLGVRAAAIRPFDKFSRLEMSLQVSGVRGRFFLGETQADAGVEELRTFIGPGLAYVSDTALFSRTGPIMGRRVRLAFESGFGELDFRSLELDLRQYWSIGQEFTLAARAYVANSWGATPQSYFLGGAYTLRGYGYGALTGNHAGLLGAEFRFPLLRYIALGWPLPLELGNVRGVLFAEGASAWDSNSFHSSRAITGLAHDLGPQVAFGFGARFDLGAYLLRVDWAQRYDPATGHMSRATAIAIGSDF